MRTTNRNRRLVKAATRTDGPLPDGIGGTITGGPMPPLDLLEVLSRGGVVFGAAHVVDNNKNTGGRGAGGIALSDGSTISFASIEGTAATADEDFRVLTPG